MRVRHVVAVANVDASGLIVDPIQARHCVIAAGRIVDLSGDVDPLTHLNLDFHEHTLGDCIVAETLERGAGVCVDAEGQFVFATTPAAALARLGRVDLDARRIAWLDLLRQRRGSRVAPDG